MSLLHSSFFHPFSFIDDPVDTAVRRMERQMNSIFEDLYRNTDLRREEVDADGNRRVTSKESGGKQLLRSGERGGERRLTGRSSWFPPLDVHEVTNKDGRHCLAISVELPGCNKENVHLEVNEGLLIMKGKTEEKSECTRENAHVTERRYGEFIRTVPLPSTAEISKLEAKMENGLLEINVPLAKDAKDKVKHIKIH